MATTRYRRAPPAVSIAPQATGAGALLTLSPDGEEHGVTFAGCGVRATCGLGTSACETPAPPPPVRRRGFCSRPSCRHDRRPNHRSFRLLHYGARCSLRSGLRSGLHKPRCRSGASCQPLRRPASRRGRLMRWARRYPAGGYSFYERNIHINFPFDFYFH